MTEFLQDHQKLATIIVVVIAIAVVAFLFILSGRNSDPSIGTLGYQPVVAHGQSGPVVQGGNSTTVKPDIRQTDFQSLLGVDLGQDSKLDEPVYFDINADGAEEALVIARGGGDSQPIDWFVVGMKDGQPVKLFERTRVAKGEVAVQGPMLVESEGIYSAGDAECCPSGSKRTFYVWKGDGLVVSRIEGAPSGAAS